MEMNAMKQDANLFWAILKQDAKHDEKHFYGMLRGNYARAKNENKRDLFLEKAYAMLFHMFPDKLAGLEGDELAKKTTQEERLLRLEFSGYAITHKVDPKEGSDNWLQEMSEFKLPSTIWRRTITDEERADEWDRWVEMAEEADNGRGLVWERAIGTIILGDQDPEEEQGLGDLK